MLPCCPSMCHVFSRLFGEVLEEQSPLQNFCRTVRKPRAVLNRKTKKEVFHCTAFPKKRAGTPCIDGWRLVTRSW